MSFTTVYVVVNGSARLVYGGHNDGPGIHINKSNITRPIDVKIQGNVLMKNYKILLDHHHHKIVDNDHGVWIKNKFNIYMYTYRYILGLNVYFM